MKNDPSSWLEHWDKAVFVVGIILAGWRTWVATRLRIIALEDKVDGQGHKIDNLDKRMQEHTIELTKTTALMESHYDDDKRQELMERIAEAQVEALKRAGHLNTK